MLTGLQKEYYRIFEEQFLKNLIGEDGIYSKIIKESNEFDAGTKALYVERALKENPLEFIMLLGKLYNDDLDGPDKEAHLQFILALKQINQLGLAPEQKYPLYLVANPHEGVEWAFNSADQVNTSLLKSIFRGIASSLVDHVSREGGPLTAPQRAARKTAEESTPSKWREMLAALESLKESRSKLEEMLATLKSLKESTPTPSQRREILVAWESLEESSQQKKMLADLESLENSKLAQVKPDSSFQENPPEEPKQTRKLYQTFVPSAPSSSEENIDPEEKDGEIAPSKLSRP